MTVTSSKPLSWSRKHLVPALIAVTICYQLIYNMILMSAVHRDEGRDECSAAPGVGNADSPHCLEMRMFRSWHDAAEEDGTLLQVTGATIDEDEAAPLQEDSAAPIAVELSGHIAVEYAHIHEFGKQVSEAPTDILPRNVSNKSDSESVTGPLKQVQHKADPIDELENKIRESLNASSKRMSNLEEQVANLSSKYGIHPESTTIAPSSFLAKRLQWSDVMAFSKTWWRPKQSWALPTTDKMSVVLRKDVRHMHWSGKIPKVACITAIQSSAHTKARLMYFINSFRLQDYEGTRELVLVYEHGDLEAAKLLHPYVDGSYIKAVASRGVEFPSAAALRFGAWSSDADVVARWDFDEWQDPSRLSMQIRAMAMTSRPACMIRHPHEVDKNDEGKMAPITSSLAGERSWMDKHWRPYGEGGSTLEPSNIVDLDMQNDHLAGSINHIKEAFESNVASQVKRFDQPESSDQDKHAESHTEVVAHDWKISECLELDPLNKAPAEEHQLEQTIDKNIGHAMGRQFHKLKRKRHDITERLQLLCMQSVVEFDRPKQLLMQEHIDQMIGIRAELDKHIADFQARAVQGY